MTSETQIKKNKKPLRWYLWIFYNVVMYGVIVVSGAILFMVMVGMLKIEDEEKKKEWIEVNSQILNGVFTWMAFTNQPSFARRMYHILRLLNVKTHEEKKEKSALYLRKRFPVLFTERTSQHQHKTTTVGFEMEDLIQLRQIYIILNCNCLFQYPITVVMWSFSAATRPGYIIGIFLPLSFLCNFGGQYKLFQLEKSHQLKQEQGGEVSDTTATTITTNATTTTAGSPATLEEIDLEEGIKTSSAGAASITRSPKTEFAIVN